MFKKKILPIGTLEYRGRTLKFDKDYLGNVVTAFKQRAFDSVPFQLAGDDNSHTNAVDRTAGTFVDLELGEDGLYGYLSATEKGSQIIRDNPDLPVSVKIIEDYERNDGKSTTKYPAALAHVLATWGPRVSGLGNWSEVVFSDDDGPVTDLSALAFTPDGVTDQENPAASGTTKKEEGTPVPVITDEQQAALNTLAPLFAELMKNQGSPEGAPQPPADQKPTEPVKPTLTAVPAPPADDKKDDEPVPVAAIAASQDEDDDKHIDLALVELRTARDRQAIELAEIKAERDAEKWRYEREQLVRDYGIPPAVVALAEPLLKGARHSVELSDGTSVDAGDVVRNVLHTVAKTYGKAVDLSGPKGTEHDHSDGAGDAAKADQQRILDWAKARKFGM
jgi:hypothetical protein